MKRSTDLVHAPLPWGGSRIRRGAGASSSCDLAERRRVNARSSPWFINHESTCYANAQTKDTRNSKATPHARRECARAVIGVCRDRQTARSAGNTVARACGVQDYSHSDTVGVFDGAGGFMISDTRDMCDDAGGRYFWVGVELCMLLVRGATRG